MKLFSEKYINSYKELNNMKIGFEFEFFSKEVGFYKMLELLNSELDPVRVHGFKTYHSKFKPTDKDFKIERDLSGGSNMIELVTGPLDFNISRYYLVKILKFISKYGYTNDKCSIHINISFDESKTKMVLKDLNILKVILNIDEDNIYELFPSRQNNIYAKSVKFLIPFKEYDFSDISISSIQNNLRIPTDDKYYGINFMNVFKSSDERRVEFRYIGGENYHERISDIINLMNEFCLLVYTSTKEYFDDNDIMELNNLLNSKINNFKNFKRYDNFLIEYPNVHIQINTQSNYDIVNAYYHRIYDKLFDLFNSSENLDECLINYYTVDNRLEIINGHFNTKMNLNDYTFVNCNIGRGVFSNCSFVNSDIKNSDITKSRIDSSNIKDSKLLNCNVEGSKVVDSTFVNGYLNSYMKGGIFRSGKLGPYANLSDDVSIVTNQSNFFLTKDEEVEKEEGKFKKWD